ncbi:MAG: CPBP family intramembrane metalloprotease, partial [Chloroflexi bacterium]|nr:CPBP family intramembrane metalloprotease [Chloroflexota bacterium]
KLAEIPLFPQMLNYYTSSSSATLPPPSLPIGFEVESQNTRFGAYRVRGFDPDSAVHMMGLVLVIYLVGVQIINFALGGGMTGVAESFEDSITTVDLLLNAAPLIILSLVGVGLGLRRNWSQTMQRLGLGLPTFEGLAVAGVLTIGLLFFVGIVSVIWMGLVSGETFEEQTEASDALSNSVSTLWLAFMVAATAAIGEEIAFRGALQPVFGLWPTSIIFALTHIQYTLTPASLIILGVALGFGWMRKRYNTTAAIATHFMYNFIPLALVVIAPEEEAFLRVLGLM